IIGKSALRYSTFSGLLDLPKCIYIGDYALQYSKFSGSLNLPACTYVGGYAFGVSKFSGSLNLPVCTDIGIYAFFNSNFDEITIGANAILGNYCIGAHSAEFIADYEANNKKAGTYVWDGFHWIYQN